MAAAPKSTWKLKRFGRFVPGSKDTGKDSWKIFESNEGEDELILAIVESGHMLVTQGQELLEGLSLLNSSSFLKVQQKSDTLLFRVSIKGESRLMRMQFGGSSRAESLKECGSAVLRLQDYLPVSSQGGAPPPLNYSPAPNQTPTDTPTLPQQSLAFSSTMCQQTLKTGSETSDLGPEVNQGSLSVKHLTQHFLGERGLSLPSLYHHCALPHGEMEPFLRLCLLDPSFPAYVEEVEGKLRRILQD